MPKNFIARIKRIDDLIIIKATGNSQQLAEKLGISSRTAKEFIAVMKEMGAPIIFNRQRNSYCYTENGKFNISFNIVQ